MKTLIILIFFIFINTKLAYSYLDPASSSYIVQLIIGAIAGFFVAIKIYWLKIKSFFFKIKKPKKN